MKKLLGIVLTIVLILALSTTAMAATITVQGAVEDETYSAYKVFDVTNSGDSYAYSIAATNPWKSVVEAYTIDGEKVFTLTPSASDANVLVVTTTVELTESNAADFAAYLSQNVPAGAEKSTVTATASGAAFENLDAGYYFVSTSLGSLCALHTNASAVNIKEKNSAPSLVKTFGDDTVDPKNASIGDIVEFKITVTDGTGTDKAITVHDTMDESLTLDASSFEITVDGTPVAAGNYTLTTSSGADDCTFEIVFKDAYVASLDTGAQIVISYAAELNTSAKISADTNENTAWLTYSQQTSEESTVTVLTYQFDLVKTDADLKLLTGAKFTLADAEGDPIHFSVNGDILTVDPDGTVSEIDMTSVAKVTICGLGNGDYTLTETVAPQGYNLLTDPVTVSINNANSTATIEDGVWKSGGIQVTNKSGSILPETGGMGTGLFYTVGGILLLGAAILLIGKKRVNA